MIKEIKVYSRLDMSIFAKNDTPFPYNNWYLISIHSGDLFLNPQMDDTFKKMGCQDSLSLEFWDLTPEIYDSHPDKILFDDNHAKQIISFIDKVQKDEKDSTLVVHCHAGISRSGAVGTFACDYCGMDYLYFMDKNPKIQANPHVLRLLRKEANMVPDFGTHDGIDPKCDILYSAFLPLLKTEEKK